MARDSARAADRGCTLMMQLDATKKLSVLPRYLTWILGCLGLVLFSLLGTACGGEDPCASKSCFFGVCESGSGQCVNQTSCRNDRDCIPGYLCGADGSCVAETACGSNADCSTGVCRSGACVNPDECLADSECLAKTYCADSQRCEPDPCNAVTCERGVCERGTGNCVAAGNCADNSECLANQKCLDNNCVARQDFCDQLTCSRGVCSYEEGGCVNAGDCNGDNARCRPGFYCTDMDRCETNLCEQNNVDCGDEGVCVPATGQCANADNCEDSNQCTDGFLCVDGVCRSEQVPCGDADGDGGCPGNQICDYDEETTTAECKEPEVCETSIDCLGDRACGGKNCLSPVSCKPDLQEPNDSNQQATDLFSQASDGFVRGSLCQEDTDIFNVITTDVVSSDFSGQLVATVTLPKRDIGLGEATLTMTGPDGRQIGTTNLGAMGQEGSMTITAGLSDSNHGTYTILISPGDNLTQSGIEYSLSVRVEKSDATGACDNPQSISPGQQRSGDTNSASASGLGSTCTSADNSSGDDVYALDISQPQEVTIEATPTQSDGDVTLSLRDRCREIATERSCTDEKGPGSSESLTTLLSEGTYYVVVQAPAGASLGSYNLTVNRNDSTTCGPGSDYCVDGTKAALCGWEGERFTEVGCNAGCNPTSGRCFPPAGDICRTAVPISINQSDSISLPIDLRQFSDDYSVSAGNCLGDQPRSTGPDAAYDVTISGRTTFTVNANFSNGVKGSMYFADDCADIDGTCVKGVQGTGSAPTEEEIFYANTSEDPVTKTLIVDTGADQPHRSVQLNFTGEELVCPPGGSVCATGGSQEKICSEDGTAFTGTEDCDSDICRDGNCLIAPSDTCTSPLNITNSARNNPNGVSYGPFAWNDFTNYSEGDACTVNITSNGYDAVMRADLKAGETLTGTVSMNQDEGTSIYIQDSCTPLSSSSCLIGKSDYVKTTSTYYYAESAQTVFMFVDSNFSLENETFSVEANISSTTCVPGESSCTGGDVQACAGDGFSQNIYSCSSGCTNGFCTNRDSDYCWDAENITSQLNASGGFSRMIDFSTFTNRIETAMCTYPQSNYSGGEDAVYAVDLQPNEKLTAELDRVGGDVQPTAYIIGHCANPRGTCKDGDDPFGLTRSSSVEYTAGNTAERVYLVADNYGSVTPSIEYKLTGSIQ